MMGMLGWEVFISNIIKSVGIMLIDDYFLILSVL
jgi:hypothetical protein